MGRSGAPCAWEGIRHARLAMNQMSALTLHAQCAQCSLQIGEERREDLLGLLVGQRHDPNDVTEAGREHVPHDGLSDGLNGALDDALKVALNDGRNGRSGGLNGQNGTLTGGLTMTRGGLYVESRDCPHDSCLACCMGQSDEERGSPAIVIISAVSPWSAFAS